LTKLPDSNPSWSIFWRSFVAPLGNDTGGRLPSPFSHDPVTLRSYLALLNFKANHRKVLVADRGDGMVAMVSSGNTHDASSAHSNVAVTIDREAAHDLIATENAVLAFSGAEPLKTPPPRGTQGAGVSVQVVTEGKVASDFFATVERLGVGEELDIAMFFVSDFEAIAALKRARERGAKIRVMLDPNRTAFGFRRVGIPNVATAELLHKAGIAVRWCDPHGEQCHSKIMTARFADGSAWISVGSTNLTRRNLRDLNLETNLVFRGRAANRLFRDARDWFEKTWTNRDGRAYSAPYDKYKREGPLWQALYRFAEGSGWSTF
jgi:phosphatidylserine/phosphatidylglycerophosphate/cardiolipin synthase-like enzyme